MRVKLLVALAAFGLGSAAAAQDKMTPLELAATGSAVERGKVIYFYDQAAWHTTDALKEDVKDLNATGIRGWVVTPVSDGLRVTYYSVTERGPRAQYIARYDGGTVHDRRVVGSDEAGILTDAELRVYRAQATANEVMNKEANRRKLLACSKGRPNTVAIPLAGEPRSVAVYYLTPQATNDSLTIGGNYRIDVPENGEPKWRSFSSSCLNLPVDRKNRGFLVTTHFLDPHPNELHAFLSLSAKVDLVVVTVEDGSAWGVSQGKITLEKRNYVKGRNAAPVPPR